MTHYTPQNSGPGNCGFNLIPQRATSCPPTPLSASRILELLKTVDGSGSGLDADTVDGYHADAFVSMGAYLALKARVTALEAGGGGITFGYYLTPEGGYYLTPEGGYYLAPN